MTDIARFWGRRQKAGSTDHNAGNSPDPSPHDEREGLATLKPVAVSREGSTPPEAEPSHFEHVTPLKRAILRKMYWSDDHINIMSPDKVLNEIQTALSFGVQVTQEEFETAKQYTLTGEH